MKENLSVTLNIHGTLSAQGIHEPLSHQLHSIYTLTDADSSQQDHNNQCQQYGNDTVCIPVIAEGVDRTTIRATHSIMSNRVSTVPALLFAYHHNSLLTALPVTGFLH